MTRLWLVRHGPTGTRGMCGWTDIPADLSDHAALGRLRAVLPHALVVSSDLSRAVATADALQGGRPRLPHEPSLREMHFGAWEMRTFSEAEAEDAVLIRALWEEPGDHASPGGESWNELCTRVWEALDRIAAQGEAVVVCHFGPILAAVQRARGIAAAEAFGQAIEPLSLTVLAPEDGGWRLEAVNHKP